MDAKGTPRPPKGIPKASQNRTKIGAGTHLGAQTAQEVQKGTHPSGNVSKIDAEVVFPKRPPIKKIRDEDTLIIDYIPATALTETGTHRRPTLFFLNARSGKKSRWRRSCHFTCAPGCEKNCDEDALIID